MRREYRLTAKHGGLRRTATVWGDSEVMDPRIVPLMVGPDATEEQICDSDASMSAMPIILNRASDDPVWAKGEIVLATKADGRVVRTMEAKS